MNPISIESLIKIFANEAAAAFTTMNQLISKHNLEMNDKEKAIFISSFMMGRLTK